MATQIPTAYIADLAVTTAKLANGSVTSAKLDSGISTAVLGAKLIGRFVFTAEQSSPAASTLDVTTLLGFDSEAGRDPAGSTKGKAVLLEAAGGAEFNTTTGLVGASAAAVSSKCPMMDASGNAIVDASGKEVWGVISATERTTSGTYTLRFFSGEFGSGSEAAYTMSQAFTFAYAQIFDLSDFPTWDTGRNILFDKEAANIAPGQIGATQLASDAVTTVKILDSNVTTAKIADLNVTTGKINDLAVTSGKLGADSVIAGKIADGAIDAAALFAAGVVDAAALASDAVTTVKILDSNVTTAKIADNNVTLAKLASAVQLRLGGGFDGLTEATGNGSTTAFDLGHSDVDGDEEAMLVSVSGLIMSLTDDYTFGDGTGAGGVDRVTFVTAPPTDALIKIRYRRSLTS